MKVIHHTLSRDFKELQILPLADLHLGDIHSDGKKILESVEYIRSQTPCSDIPAFLPRVGRAKLKLRQGAPFASLRSIMRPDGRDS